MYIENCQKINGPVCALQLYYHKMGLLTQKLWTTCCNVPHWVHK